VGEQLVGVGVGCGVNKTKQRNNETTKQQNNKTNDITDQTSNIKHQA
jgi:hypothetical protein